jgi:hypothetical protein
MAFDRHVVGWVGEDRGRAVLPHQHLVRILLDRAAAMDPVRPQLPEVTRPAYCRPRFRRGYLVIGISLRSGALDPQIDLADLETGHLEAEVELELGELAQLLGEKPFVPGSDLGQPVVGDREGLCLRWRQVLKADCRNFREAQLARRQQTAMSGNHPEIGIDQDGHVEAKGLDTARDLPDLLLAMASGVARIGLQQIDGMMNYIEGGFGQALVAPPFSKMLIHGLLSREG